MNQPHNCLFGAVHVKNADGTISSPCKICGSELRFIPNGFKNPLGLKYFEPDGLEWVLMRECEEFYEKRLNIDENSVVVDIGAHVGVVSMTLAKQYGCKVYAYEPNPNNYRRLLENIKLNGMEDSIEPYQLAVTGDGRKTTISEDANNSGGARIDIGGEPVDSITLPQIIEKVGKIDLLKIDVEGAEYEILADMELLRNNVRILRGEFHRNGNQFEELMPKVVNAVQDVFMVVVG